MGEWILGCDVCQEVCPWNNKAPFSEESAFQPLPENNPLELAELFDLTDDEFRQRFSKNTVMAPQASRHLAKCGHRSRKSASTGEPGGVGQRAKR